MFLQGKRILFFSAHLFGYQNDIRLAMESVGAIVDYYDERPANNFLVKGVIRINRNLLAGYINNQRNTPEGIRLCILYQRRIYFSK